jgi:hypothetical protein
MRKQIGIIVFLALGLTMAGCGTGSPGSGNINGTWVATLSNSAYSFSTTFTQSSGSGISVTNFTFTSTAPCFASDATAETGSFTLMGNSNGNVTGSFGMTITAELSGINSVLTLIGTVNGNTISGTWNLTGSTGCTGNGTFTLQTSAAA